MMFGLALVFALILGATSMAFGANGDFLKLGSLKNVATRTTALVGKVATGSSLTIKNPSGGSALDLRVGDPTADAATKITAPMQVDSQAKVANLNSDTLDGLDSTNFVHGNGTVYQGAVALAQGSHWSPLLMDTQDPDIGLQYYCPDNVGTDDGTVAVLNRTFLERSQTVNVFADNGSLNPAYESLDAGHVHNEGAARDGEHITFQIQAPGPKILTIELFSKHRAGIVSGDCHVEWQAFLTR